jgi:hypothetical protein
MQATSPQVAFHGAPVAVTVLMAGVHRAKWESLQASEASSGNARSRMRQRRFDVLPVENGGRIRSFYRTARWNDYHEIKEERLVHRDVLYQRPPVRDTIKGMASEKRFFYFLVEGSNVVGLFSSHIARIEDALFRLREVSPPSEPDRRARGLPGSLAH